MRHHLNHRSVVRAVSITCVALLLGLGTLAPGALADTPNSGVEDGFDEGDGSVFVPVTQNRLCILLTESKEAAPPEAIAENIRQIQRLEDLSPDSAFGGDESSEYCFRCYSYR